MLERRGDKPDEGGLYVDRCRTNGKPYDEVVTAALALLDHFLPSACEITSDSGAKDWQDGIALVELATGLCVNVPSYIHRWSRPRKYDHDAFAAWRADVAKVIKATDIPLAFPEQVRDGLEPHKVGAVWLFASAVADSYVDISPVFERKMTARLAHASQTADPAVPERFRTRDGTTGAAAGLDLAETFTIITIRR